MAAINFSMNFTDTGNNGSGPYTVQLFKNPTTSASGGTAVTVPTQTANTTAISFFEWAVLLAHLAVNQISIANQNDANN